MLLLHSGPELLEDGCIYSFGLREESPFQFDSASIQCSWAVRTQASLKNNLASHIHNFSPERTKEPRDM